MHLSIARSNRIEAEKRPSCSLPFFPSLLSRLLRTKEGTNGDGIRKEGKFKAAVGRERERTRREFDATS